jgi:hypothetical protein
MQICHQKMNMKKIETVPMQSSLVDSCSCTPRACSVQFLCTWGGDAFLVCTVCVHACGAGTVYMSRVRYVK